MLIIQIALGIVLAVLILCFVRELFAIALLLIGLVVAIVAIGAMYEGAVFVKDAVKQEISSSKQSSGDGKISSNISTPGAPTGSHVATPPRSVSSEVKPPKAIQDWLGDERLAEVAGILSNRSAHCPTNGLCESGRFILEPVDINADGKNEYIVTDTHRDFCGSGGCTTVLLSEAADHSWKVLAGVFGGISVLSGSTKGYRDIQHVAKAYLDGGGFYHKAQEFSWVGHEYVARGKPKALPEQER